MPQRGIFLCRLSVSTRWPQLLGRSQQCFWSWEGRPYFSSVIIKKVIFSFSYSVLVKGSCRKKQGLFWFYRYWFHWSTPRNAQNIGKVHIHIHKESFHNRKWLFHNNTGQVFWFGFNFEAKLAFSIYPILSFRLCSVHFWNHIGF